jgi:hypothetical protein
MPNEEPNFMEAKQSIANDSQISYGSQLPELEKTVLAKILLKNEEGED